MIPLSMIDDNLFPGRKNLAQRRMEKEFLLFADTRKSHAKASDPTIITQYLDYAEKMGSNFEWVQLHSGYLFNHTALPNYPASGIEIDEGTNAYLDEAIALCKARGKKVCYTVGNYAPLDSLLQRYPQVRNLQNGLFFNLVHDAIINLFERFPGLDEMGLYFFESVNILHFTNFFKCMNYGLDINETVQENEPQAMRQFESYNYPYLSFGDHLRMLLQAAARACKEKGKTLKVLTHVWFPFQEELLVEAFRDFPPELPVILEHNYTTGDFNPHLPFPAMIKKLPHLLHALVFCCGMEYHGLSLVPCCFPEEMHATVLAALDDTPNLERIVVRPVWDGCSLLGTPNEVNMLTMLRTADNPAVSTEDIWHEWILSRYGLSGQAAQTMLRLLRRSYAVVRDVNFMFGIRTNDHSHIPDFHHLESRLHNYGKAVMQWNPTPANRQQVYDLLVRPDAKVLRMMQEIHDDAQVQITSALAELEQIADGMNPADVLDIRTRYEDMQVWVELHRHEYDAYVRLLAYRRDQRDTYREGAETSLAALEKLVGKIRKQEIRDNYLFSLDHIDEFLVICRKEFCLEPC